MTVGAFLKQATSKLQKAGSESARLDVLVLLEDALGQDRASLLAHLEAEIDQLTETALNNKIVQRAKNIPLAYIRGKAFFYGREFAVNSSVLIPRPETETMIDMLKAITLPAKPIVADIGCGSGCIGITAALEFPNATVHLYDIDESALNTARKNAAVHGANVAISKRDLLAGNSTHFDAVLANLPYVPETLSINAAATFEPPLAIFGGQDGLDLYRKLWQQLATRRPKVVLTESLGVQHEAMEKLADRAGFSLVATDGLVQYFAPNS